MTDDTLRQECSAWIQKYCPNDYHVDDLLAFARAQQAAGLREAVAIGRATISALYQASPSHARGIEVANALVEAQATARETDATKKGSSPS